MKKLLEVFTLLFLLGVTSCMDSLQSLNDEHTELLEVELNLLKEFDRGVISEAEVIRLFEELREKTEQLNERYVRFHEKSGESTEGEWYTVNDEENTALYSQQYRMIDKLKKAGRWSDKLDRTYRR